MITVKELIEKLQKLDPEIPIILAIDKHYSSFVDPLDEINSVPVMRLPAKGEYILSDIENCDSFAYCL